KKETFCRTETAGTRSPGRPLRRDGRRHCTADRTEFSCDPDPSVDFSRNFCFQPDLPVCSQYCNLASDQPVRSRYGMSCAGCHPRTKTSLWKYALSFFPSPGSVSDHVTGTCCNPIGAADSRLCTRQSLFQYLPDT